MDRLWTFLVIFLRLKNAILMVEAHAPGASSRCWCFILICFFFQKFISFFPFTFYFLFRHRRTRLARRVKWAPLMRTLSWFFFCLLLKNANINWSKSPSWTSIPKRHYQESMNWIPNTRSSLWDDWKYLLTFNSTKIEKKMLPIEFTRNFFRCLFLNLVVLVEPPEAP